MGAFCPPLRILMLDNSTFINIPTGIWYLEQPQRNAKNAYLCATRPRWRRKAYADRDHGAKEPPLTEPRFGYPMTLGIIDVHSGSEEISLEGTPYNSG